MRRIRVPPEDPYVAAGYDRRLELGCGRNKLHPDAIGVDVLGHPGVDLVGTIPDVLSSIETASIDVVYSYHFLEHVDDLTTVMAACGRILRRGGKFIAVVPHFSNPYFYSDPTHATSFGLYSMSYFAVDDSHRRQVPKYVVSDDDVLFTLTASELRFSASWRRPVSRIVGGLFESLARRSVRVREFYEFRLPWLIPCSEVRFELERR